MGISKDRIVEASIEILNREGSQKLSMRELAKELDVKAASLYWHIEDKTELFSLIAEHICSRINMTATPDEPKKYLYEFSSRLRSNLLAVRDSVYIFTNSPPNTPERACFAKNSLICLSKIGVRDENCLTAANMLNNYVLSFVEDEVRVKSGVSGQTEMIDERFGKWRAKSMFYFESQFLYGLEVLFAGIKAVSPFGNR